MKIALWISQIVLAGMFLMAGFMKSTAPIETLAAQMVWPGDVPAAMVRFIGIMELLGALGLILPAALRIKPVLTPISAVGLALIMLFALVFHISRGENGAIGFNLILMALAIFIAWGRFKKIPVKAR